MDILAKDSDSKEAVFEALDFLVNVLKEHEKDFDRLINKLAKVSEHFGETGELRGKIESVEEKIDNLHQEVTNLISKLSSDPPKEALPVSVNGRVDEAAPAVVVQDGSYVTSRCEQWADFQSLAFQAQTMSFSIKEDEKVFQVDALKGSQIITYLGALPKFSTILKTWLSEQLDVPEKNIFEGSLSIA